MRFVTGSLLSAAALTAPATAVAGTVSMTGSTLSFRASPGEANSVRVSRYLESKIEPPSLRAAHTEGIPFHDPYIVRPSDSAVGPGCATYSPPIAVAMNICPGGATRVVVAAGDLNDFVELAPVNINAINERVQVPALITGGPGNDDLTGGDGDDDISAGSGVNSLHGLAGNDRLRARNGVRDTVLDCGNGIDTAVIDKVDPRPLGCETVLRPRS